MEDRGRKLEPGWDIEADDTSISHGSDQPGLRSPRRPCLPVAQEPVQDETGALWDAVSQLGSGEPRQLHLVSGDATELALGATWIVTFHPRLAR